MAVSSPTSISGSGTLEPVFSGPALTAPRTASTWRRSRCGRIASSLARARVLVSSIPLIPVAAARPTVMATASSSSSSSGGSLAPTPSR